MAIETPNYHLVKPGQSDFYNVDNFNFNSDVIDLELSKSEKIELKGQPNGYVPLDENGLIPLQFLPPYAIPARALMDRIASLEAEVKALRRFEKYD